MEGDVGAQVAPSILLHQSLPGRFLEGPTLPRKRDFGWQNPGRHNHQNLQQTQQRVVKPGHANTTASGWNCNTWEWDSDSFIAKPTFDGSGCTEGEERKKVEEENLKDLAAGNDKEQEASLTLNLGRGSFSPAEEPVVRPNKRVRSVSLGSGGNYPMCQVDDCKADLSNAKDYHRRHKVCEQHSKTTSASVGKQMQRFCQQCSRFHPLSEFDEGKRSCRRRLAGHNRRRRKVQADDASSRMLLSGKQDNNGNGSLDIVNLLSMLACLQGNSLEKLANGSSIPDRDKLIQLIGIMNSIPAVNTKEKPVVAGGFDLNVPQSPPPSEHLPEINESQPAASTMDLLTVLSTALKSSMPESTALSQGSSGCSEDDKVKMNCSEPAADFSSHNQINGKFPLGTERRNCAVRPFLEVHEQAVHQTKSALPLQLFSSAEDGSPPKLCSPRKYPSSESSNPMEEVSPSSSPPVAQRLFPLHSGDENLNNEKMPILREDITMLEASTCRKLNLPLDKADDTDKRVNNQVVQNSLCQMGGYTSSSCSDHSPSSSNSINHDRTNHIIVKLFDKDPSQFPGTIKTQILNWLSHIPTEMESYIRPGCVVLSVYLSMPPAAWGDFQEDLLKRIHVLLQCPDSNFWRNGRFLIHTDQQLLSHKDGKIRLCKTWKSCSAPELKFVSPLAVVRGKETRLLLKGRNLSIPGTKIHCTYMGGYITKEVLGSDYSCTLYDDSSSESFSFPGWSSNDFGRCFIEVENGFKGNSFPIIVADDSICQELQDLESELDDMRITEDERALEQRKPMSRDDILHFLNELGWLFQRLNAHSILDFSCIRFKFLLSFAVERDWPSLSRKLLDILVERSYGKADLVQESLEALSELQLLTRAVKRKCRKMVDMLVYYSSDGGINTSKTFLFPPNLAGPGGVTPLHLAASTEESQDIVDALTSDPQEIGMNCWSSLLDDNGLSPFAYASMRNHHWYNKLVARKLSDRRNCQVSIMVGCEEASLDKSWIVKESEGADVQHAPKASSCSRCAIMEHRRSRSTIHSQGLLRRPFVHSMLGIAAVCVCVCLILRGAPQVRLIAPFKWENLQYGPR